LSRKVESHNALSRISLVVFFSKNRIEHNQCHTNPKEHLLLRQAWIEAVFAYLAIHVAMGKIVGPTLENMFFFEMYFSGW